MAKMVRAIAALEQHCWGLCGQSGATGGSCDDVTMVTEAATVGVLP